MTIFISIAAYRDPQLVPTVEDCLAKARDPEELRFGICRQGADDEGALPFALDPRFRIIDVSWRESRGVCWARSAIMELYAGEDYFLQLDSHHRFVPDWDVKLLDQLKRTGSPKPILTTYATPFHPDDPSSFVSGKQGASGSADTGRVRSTPWPSPLVLTAARADARRTPPGDSSSPAIIAVV